MIEMEFEFILILITIIIGMLEIVMGVPLLLQKIKPNLLFGFRLPKTLSSEEVWYKSNVYVGRDFIIAGIVVVTGSLILLAFISELTILMLTWIAVILLTVPMIAVIIRGVIYLKKL